MYEISNLPPPPPAATRHSRLGIASFVLAIVAVSVMCVDFIIVAAMGGVNPTNLTFNPIDTALSCTAGLVAMVGLGLGIAAVVQKNEKKVFGVLGLVFNGLYLLGYCAIVAFNVVRIYGS